MADASLACAAALVASSGFMRASFQGLIPTEIFFWGWEGGGGGGAPSAAFVVVGNGVVAGFLIIVLELDSKSPLKASTVCGSIQSSQN